MSSTLINREVERNILHSTSERGKTRAGEWGRRDGKTGGREDGRARCPPIHAANTLNDMVLRQLPIFCDVD